MKRLFLLFLFAFNLSLKLYSQDDVSNYVRTMTFVQKYDYDIDDNMHIDSLLNKTTTIQYFDGLGRPTIKAQNGVNTANNYVYTMQTYDQMGRGKEQWLPIIGDIIPNYMSRGAYVAASYNTYNDNYAYSTTSYDALGREIETTSPGEAWHSAGKKTLKSYEVEANYNNKYSTPLNEITLDYNGKYSKEELTGETYTDEDGHSVKVHKDFMGNVVYENHDGNRVHYVYNPIGQLRYVLTPKYLDQGFKADNGYEYRYDARGRMVKKILPGCDYMEYWYNKEDQQVFYQDATVRSKGVHRFFLYDIFGRLAIQGTCKSCNKSQRANICYKDNTSSSFYGTAYRVKEPEQLSGVTIESVNYYDNYHFLEVLDNHFSNIIDSLFIDNYSIATGLPTGKMQVASNGEKTIEVIYYDYRGRKQDVLTVSVGNKFTHTRYDYTFTDNVKRESIYEYKITDNGCYFLIGTTITNNYSETNGILLSTNVSFKTSSDITSTHTIQALEYDSLGRLSKNTRGGNAGYVSYQYDVHGWPTVIDGTGFRQELHYADGLGTPCYNGNISSMQWSTPEYHQMRGYKFEYDACNRLKSATYGEREDMSNAVNRYNELVESYNENGIVERIRRRGLKDDGKYGTIDNIKITIEKNRPIKILDYADAVNSYAAYDFHDGANVRTEYTYNGMGALTSDANKGIARIEYDINNNPRLIQFTNGNQIWYVYTPDGVKHRTTYITAAEYVTVPLNTTIELQPAQILVKDSTDFNGYMIYNNGALSKCLLQGCYATIENGNAVMHYFTKDHLGNNRAVVNENGTIEQITHYYPFGGIFADAGLNSSLQPYKYNSKELDRMHGLNWYDYGARRYDPVCNLWTSPDPMAEKYYHVSPYVYCKNDPINKFDPNGMDDYYTENGDFIYSDGQITDNLIIRNQLLYDLKTSTNAEWINPYTPIGDLTLSAEAYSNIFTDILSKMPEVNISYLHNSKVSVTVWDDSENVKTTTNYFNDSRFYGDALATIGKHQNGKQCLTAYIFPRGTDEHPIYNTVSNIQNLLGIHEYIGHFKNNLRDAQHSLVYENQMKHPSWAKTTKKFKQYILNTYNQIKTK